MINSGPVKQRVKSVLRLIFFPVIRYFGPRFHMLHLKLDRTNDAVSRLSQRLERFEGNVALDLQTTVEFANTLQRTAAVLSERTAKLDQLSAHVDPNVEIDPETADRAAAALIGTPLEKLGPGAAQFLNWASSGGESGFQVQAGMWFNPAVAIQHEPGNVRPIFVNERIVEMPYAITAAARVKNGATVIDVGANESLLSLSLASRGLNVLAVDPRGYALPHPAVTVIKEAVQTWAGPRDPVAAIFCVSTLEHLGVGSYDQELADLDLDRFVVDRFRSWLRPGGELILTVPYGRWSVDDFQRIYDHEHLENLLKSWSVHDRQVFVHESPFVWRQAPPEIWGREWDKEEPGVALITAVPEG